MTAQNIYDRALALCGIDTQNNPYYSTISIQWINAALVNTKSFNNWMRQYRGLPEQAEAAQVTSMTSSVNVEVDVAEVLPEIVAAYMFADMGDNFKATDCRMRADNLMRERMRSLPHAIRDCYSEVE